MVRSRLGVLGVVASGMLATVATAYCETIEKHPKRGEADAAVAAIIAIDADEAYGAYLAGDCVTCHRPSGGDGIPPIAGLPAEYIVNALVEYKLKIRGNEVMVVRTSRLAEEEIAALAAHFSTQNP